MRWHDDGAREGAPSFADSENAMLLNSKVVLGCPILRQHPILVREGWVPRIPSHGGVKEILKQAHQCLTLSESSLSAQR